jgi:hypothetical protein
MTTTSEGIVRGGTVDFVHESDEIRGIAEEAPAGNDLGSQNVRGTRPLEKERRDGRRPAHNLCRIVFEVTWSDVEAVANKFVVDAECDSSDQWGDLEVDPARTAGAGPLLISRGWPRS